MSGRMGGRSLSLMPGEGDTLPCDLCHDACDVPTPPVNRQTPVKALPSRNLVYMDRGGFRILRRRGRQPTILRKFSKKLHEFWAVGGRAPWAPPRSTTVDSTW